jgi:hypothetical protein
LYGHLRDAESVRLALNRLGSSDRNYDAYQQVFARLATKAYEVMLKLEGSLAKERSPFEKFRELMSAIAPSD